MGQLDQLDIALIPNDEMQAKNEYDLDRIIYDLDSQLSALSTQGDSLDYLLSIGSGLLCGILDILWVGPFNLERGRNFASTEIDDIVMQAAKLLGCETNDLTTAVRFLEERFPVPSDGNTADFGGALQHHLRDFAHHPTIVGLIFSLLTQFTGKAYGTDRYGMFMIVEVPEASQCFIGNDVPSKLLFGMLSWFFHLVSDMAGSSSSAGRSGGTGIPGPLLSLAKELSALPFFRETRNGNTLSVVLSKLFNGTLLAERDASGAIVKDGIIRFDLRGELGVGAELGRQALPVVANECIVRGFYFIRRFATVLREEEIHSLKDIKHVNWDRVKPKDNPTIARMLTIATGVFTTVDIGEAVLTQKMWVSVNYIGMGRFAVALGNDIAWGLKSRKIDKIKHVYEDIKRFSFMNEDNRLYERIENNINNEMGQEEFGLTIDQIEILYNLEYYKTLNDIHRTRLPLENEKVKRLKREWLDEWKTYLTRGFSSFTQVDGSELHWYTEQELVQQVERNKPDQIWFRLVLLEGMLFEPYFTIEVEKDRKGNLVPSKKYKSLQNVINGYNKSDGDKYLDSIFIGGYYPKDYIKRLRKCYDKVLRELNEVVKTALTSLTIAAVIAVAAIATAGAFAPAIAVALVGSNFAGLSGAALTSACLAYLGGGAVAVGGAGMAGGTIAIVGGGAALGLGAGAGIGGAVGVAGLAEKKTAILQSAKLLVSVREIFLNDEHDIKYSNSVYEKYVENILDAEKGITEMRLQADLTNGREKKELKEKIKKAEESVEVMRIARRSLAKFISSFEEGFAQK